MKWWKGVIFVITGLVGLILLSVLLSWWFIILVIFVGFTSFAGWREFHQEQRVLVELMGRFWKIFRPGWYFFNSFLMRVREIATLQEQPIDLFIKQGQQEVWIDCKEGRLGLVNPQIRVRLIGAEQRDEGVIEESIKESVYDVTGWKEAIRSVAETALASCLNKLTIEEALEAKAKDSWWEVVRIKYPRLEGQIREWGYGVAGSGITFSNCVVNKKSKQGKSRKSKI